MQHMVIISVKETFVPIQVIVYPAKLVCPRRGTFVIVHATYGYNLSERNNSCKPQLAVVTFPMVNMTIIAQHIEVLQS